MFYDNIIYRSFHVTMPSVNQYIAHAQSHLLQVGGEYPLIISEYNSGLYLLDDNQDTNYAAAFIAHVCW